MSATLRYDIGTRLADIIYRTESGNPKIMQLLKAKEAKRWNGFDREDWKVITFSIKLPCQIELMMRLREILKYADDHSSFVIRSDQKSVRLFWRKLTASLGLPLDDKAYVNEIDFIDPIHGNPSDLATWYAYADRLLEDRSNEPNKIGTLRGELIKGWIDQKPIKVKYGIPELIRGKIHFQI